MIEFKVIKTDWDELEKLGYVSVTDYCRHLVKQGDKLPDRIEVYRGEMLCITVTDVAVAATLEPTGLGWRLDRPTSLSKGRGEVKNEKR